MGGFPFGVPLKLQKEEEEEEEEEDEEEEDEEQKRGFPSKKQRHPFLSDGARRFAHPPVRLELLINRPPALASSQGDMARSASDGKWSSYGGFPAPFRRRGPLKLD